MTGDKLWFRFSCCQVDQPELGEVLIETDDLGPVVIVEGAPNAATQCEMNACATISAACSGMGIATGQQVKRSTHVSRYVLPSDGGGGPTRSM